MSRQQGQAMFEMLIVSAAIMVLLFGLIWLQRWQQIKVKTQHHAALQAFRFSQSFELGSINMGSCDPALCMATVFI